MTISLKIEDIILETKDAKSFRLRQPGLRKIKYQAGQFMTISVKIADRNYKRSYSISSAPSLDSTLNITVKRVKGGIVSNHLIDNLKIGDFVEVSEPMGNFYQVLYTKLLFFLKRLLYVACVHEVYFT